MFYCQYFFFLKVSLNTSLNNVFIVLSTVSASTVLSHQYNLGLVTVANLSLYTMLQDRMMLESSRLSVTHSAGQWKNMILYLLAMPCLLDSRAKQGVTVGK